MKFKVDKNSKGTGIVSIEKLEARDGDYPTVHLIFRNKFGALLFQGQFTKNISKYLKPAKQKTYKIQRSINVIGKKDAKSCGCLKCTITVMFHFIC